MNHQCLLIDYTKSNDSEAIFTFLRLLLRAHDSIPSGYVFLLVWIIISSIVSFIPLTLQERIQFSLKYFSNNEMRIKRKKNMEII